MSELPIYEPLGSNSIRLLSIIPGFSSETIRCNLHTVDINQAPTYDALSYVWGTEESDERITCNGEKVKVTKNLINALRHLRPLPRWESVISWPTDHKLHSIHNAWREFATNRQEKQEHSNYQQNPIWIDAICINQNDNIEKANQVKLMDVIYANASLVRIWLGKTEDSPLNLYREHNNSLSPQERQKRELERQTDAYSHTVRTGVHLGQYGKMPIILAFVAQALRNSKAGNNCGTELGSSEDAIRRNLLSGFPSRSSREWNIVREFFSNQWFQRIWIMQEVVLAKQAIAIMGNWQIEWTAIGQAAAWFQANGFALPTIPIRGEMEDLLPVSRVATMWQMHSDKRRPLLQVLRDFRGRQATLNVDRVYAAYSLAEETRRTTHLDPLIEPAYDKSCAEVYRDLARFLVIENGDLLVLSHAAGIQETRTSPWPSWVPDWSQQKTSTELADHYQGVPLPYHADGGQCLTIGDSTDPECFSVQGVPADVIQKYGDKLISYGIQHKMSKEDDEFVLSSWKLVEHLTTGIYSQKSNALDGSKTTNLQHAFISTLTAGLTDTCQPIEKDPGFIDAAVDWLLKHFNHKIPLSSLSQKSRWPDRIWTSSNAGRFHKAFTRVCLNRRFFVTAGDLMGIGPETIETGDVIAVLFGGKVPYVLRQLGEG
ncbi:heterokaryon incompatibility protein-domain-containing protein [Hypoxylon rubiginosum]|uniref:Heterokaryon incompatibility protein-domain-containing protein n=1 Tax=Hypoxylon rubiginosum TaxID=110542 RepID=A0ACC0CIY4_9PEZI|nr:heterokaryon incompatibility protein-domain-containing protein [Hypoxylon rubiginosum]